MKVKDGRRRGWFWAHDSIFDEWGETLGPIALNVYLCLCRHAGKDGNSYPSLATLARKCGVTRRATINAVAKLESYKLIEKVRRIASKGDPDTNIYTVLDPCNEKALEARGSERSAPPLVNVVHHPSERSAPPLVNVVHHPSERSAPPLVNVVHHPSERSAPHEGQPQNGQPQRTTTTTTAGATETGVVGDAGGKNCGGGSGDGSQKNTKTASRQEGQPAGQQTASRQEGQPLVYPLGMAMDETTKAAAMLDGHQNAQEMLDTVEAARRAGQIKKSPLALLAALIRRDKEGSFDPSPGYEIAKGRQRQCVGAEGKSRGVSKAVELSNLQAEVKALEAMASRGGEALIKQLETAKARLNDALRQAAA